MTRKYLLSIDGGGIRGIIPAMALLKLEESTNRLSREIFSFVAGTSTGALIAAAIAAGIPAARIVGIYKNRLREIFAPARPWSHVRRCTVGQCYHTSNLNRVLREEFGSAARLRLSDSPIDILITAKGLADGKPWYFVRDNPRNSGLTGCLPLVDCATASAAAPTYFSPWRMPAPVNGKLVDGGVGVTGNPVYQACVEAFLYSHGYQPEETTVISFGAGRFLKEANPQTIVGWLDWVSTSLLHSPGDQQTELVERHYSTARLYRLDPKLPADIGLDDVRRIAELEAAGNAFAQRADWQAIFRGDPV